MKRRERGQSEGMWSKEWISFFFLIKRGLGMCTKSVVRDLEQVTSFLNIDSFIWGTQEKFL